MNCRDLHKKSVEFRHLLISFSINGVKLDFCSEAQEEAQLLFTHGTCRAARVGPNVLPVSVNGVVFPSSVTVLP